MGADGKHPAHPIAGWREPDGEAADAVRDDIDGLAGVARDDMLQDGFDIALPPIDIAGVDGPQVGRTRGADAPVVESDDIAAPGEQVFGEAMVVARLDRGGRGDDDDVAPVGLAAVAPFGGAQRVLVGGDRQEVAGRGLFGHGVLLALG